MGPKDLPSERLRQDAGAAHLHSSPSRFMSGPRTSSSCTKRFFRPSCGSGAGFRCLAGTQNSENCRLIPAHARKCLGFATDWLLMHRKSVQRSYASGLHAKAKGTAPAPAGFYDSRRCHNYIINQRQQNHRTNSRHFRYRLMVQGWWCIQQHARSVSKKSTPKVFCS